MSKQQTFRGFHVGQSVHYHSVIGEGHDGKVYRITHLGSIPSNPEVAWLDGKAGCVSLLALSLATSTSPIGASDAVQGGDN